MHPVLLMSTIRQLKAPQEGYQELSFRTTETHALHAAAAALLGAAAIMLSLGLTTDMRSFVGATFCMWSAQPSESACHPSSSAVKVMRSAMISLAPQDI